MTEERREEWIHAVLNQGKRTRVGEKVKGKKRDEGKRERGMENAWRGRKIVAAH